MFTKGNVTVEKISAPEELWGALANFAAILLLRFALVIISVLLILAVGRGAGPLFLAATAVYCVAGIFNAGITPRDLVNERMKLLGALLIGLALWSLALFEQWPPIAYFYTEGRLVMLIGQKSYTFGAWATWARLMAVGLIPGLVLAPTRWLEWTLRMELTYKKLREAIPQTLVPDGIKGPDGEALVAPAQDPPPAPYTGSEDSSYTATVRLHGE